MMPSRRPKNIARLELEGKLAPVPAQQPAQPAPAPDTMAVTLYNAGAEAPASAPSEPAPAPPVQAAPPDPDLSAELERVRAELQAEREARKAEAERSAEAARVLEEAERNRRAWELENSLNFEGVELNSVDPEDAKKIARSVIPVIEDRNRKVEEELVRYKTMAEQQAKRLAEDGVRGARLEVEREVRAAVPEYDRLLASPEFIEYLKGPFYVGANYTRGAMMTWELDRGNAPFIIDQFKSFINSKPSLADQARVRGAALHGAPAAPARPGGDDRDRSLFEEVRSGRVTVKDYRAKLARSRQERNRADA
jgi:hypothetical protein